MEVEVKVKLTEIAHFVEWLTYEINKDGLSPEELKIANKMADRMLKAKAKSGFNIA